MTKITSWFSPVVNWLKPKQTELKEAPRFEDWFHQMFPKDTYNPSMDEFGKTILEFKNEQKRKLTQ